MNHRKLRILIALLLVSCPLLAHAEHRTIFDAKVIKIEPWMPIKISCGVMLVTRLAEYEVKTVYQGHVDSRRVIVRHLACHGDELDDLKAGEDVLIVVAKLKTPEVHVWRTLPVGSDNGPELKLLF